MKRFLSFSRHSFGVRNRSPWGSMLGHTLHQFHENDLFTSAAAMSYFGLMALFPALLLLFATVWPLFVVVGLDASPPPFTVNDTI